MPKVISSILILVWFLKKRALTLSSEIKQPYQKAWTVQKDFYVIFCQYPGKKALDIADHPELPAIVRVELWFGLEQHQSNWTAREQSEGEFGVLAETVS